MVTVTEPNSPRDWLVSESPNYYSREEETLLAGSGAEIAMVSGQVLGKLDRGTASSAAKSGGNTGGGTMGSVTVGAEAQAGVYTLRIIEAASDAGVFEVKDPNGVVVGLGNVAVAFSGGGLSFTLADGAPDFAVGDGFDITVAAGSGKLEIIDFAENDGVEDAYGILVDPVTVPDGADAQGVVIVRDAQIYAANLTWPAGATTDQKNAALAQLAAKGIITREGF